MITRTFITKSNTIFENSKGNFGLNPIMSLTYGKGISRGLLYFDCSKLKEKYDDKTFAVSSSLSHKLIMTNCGSVNNILSEEVGDAVRSSSFTLIAFKLPKLWDSGVGFDKSDDFWFVGKKVYSENGSNWYQATNETPWDVNGIYSTETLETEYEKYLSGQTSIIIGSQHFDHGNERLEMDITDYVNSILAGESANKGIGIAFVPDLEYTTGSTKYYVGFFNNNTNTFFQPYIETNYKEEIIDNRYNFFLKKKNRLYLYVSEDGFMKNLDNLPVCKIKNTSYEVKQQTKGVYYAEVKFTNEYQANTILSDEWSNLSLDGTALDNVEQEFVVLSSSQFGDERLGGMPSVDKLVPSVSGINDKEAMEQGEIRMVKVEFRIPYTKSNKITPNGEYRIYIKDNNKEIDVIPWDSISLTNSYNYFLVNTDELLPQKYLVDIKIKYGQETRIFKEQLKFEIKENITEATR